MSATNSARFLFLLEVCQKEAVLLTGTVRRLLTSPIDGKWVESLEDAPVLAERVDAFVARLGRLQDTLGDKLVPELRRQMLETPAASLDNLNRMEKLGLLDSVIDWMEARNLRYRLVHEYMVDAEEFAGALNRARQLVPLLIDTNNRINAYARSHFGDKAANWPDPVQMDEEQIPSG